MSGMDLGNLHNIVMDAVNNRLPEIMNNYLSTIQNRFTTMELNDLSMSKDYKYRDVMGQTKFRLEQTGDYTFQVVIEYPETDNDDVKDLMRMYVDNSKKWTFG